MNIQELRVATDSLWCKCGSPEVAAAALLKALEMFPLHSNDGRERMERWLGDDEGLFYLLVGLLDEKGFIEHGTSIRGSWLTPKGEQVRDALKREAVEDGFVGLTEPCCIHGFSIDRDEGPHTCVAERLT